MEIKNNNLQHIILYFSPAGTTEVVAQRIARVLEREDQAYTLVDLTGDYKIQPEWRHACLWLGSPVYCDHALPLIHDFIQKLPVPHFAYSVPFVTWGGVTSGLALPEMANDLNNKGYKVLGAAKVLAQHSSLWFSAQPLGAHHPNEEDLKQLDQLVKLMVKKIQENKGEGLNLAQLDYLSPALKEDAQKKSLPKVKEQSPPRQVDPSRCKGCGICVDICPVKAITLKNYPKISSACILCLQCVRHCPTKAFPMNESLTETRLNAMASVSDEEKKTKIFY